MHVFARLLSALPLVGASALALAQTPISFEINANCSRLNLSCSSNSAVQADFNNDGKPDLLTADGTNAGQNLNLRLGNGDGTFQNPIPASFVKQDAGATLLAVDLNKDGILDLVVSSYNNPVIDVLFGKGGGAFGPPVILTLSASTLSNAVVGDFNGDGFPDIAVGDLKGNIELFQNAGNGSFTLAKTISGTSGFINSLAAADVDGDGHTDLAFTDLATDGTTHAYVLWGLGDNDFRQVLLNSYPLTDTATATVTTGDLNQDGSPDLLVSYDCAPVTDPGAGKGTGAVCTGIDVYYGGQGKQTTFYRHAVTDANANYARQLLPVDVNNDGIADLVSPGEVENSRQGLLVWLGHPDGSFDQAAQYFLATSNGIGSVVTGDFNRSGKTSFLADGRLLFTNATQPAPCNIPSQISPTVLTCGAVDNTYLPSPVFTWAAVAYDKTQITDLQLYVDGTLSNYSRILYRGSNAFLDNGNVGLHSPGSHLLVTKGWDASGVSFRTNRHITVYNGTPGLGCAAAPKSASICLPFAATSTSPIRILANGATPSIPTAAQLYIDGSLVVNDTTQSTVVDATETLQSGSHELVFKLYDADGNVYTASKTVTVQ